MQRLELPQRHFDKLPKKRLPTLNEIIGMHYRAYSRVKKEVFKVVVSLAKRRLQPVEKYPVRIIFYWYVADKRSDPDNISSAGRKLILDGLQRANILTNDGWHQFITSQDEVQPFTDYYALDKANPRVVVEIQPIEGENNAKQQPIPWPEP